MTGSVGRPEIDAWILAHTGGPLPGNWALGIGGRVVRGLAPDGSPLVAVAGDSEFETQVHSLVDLLHWQQSAGLAAKRGRVVIGSGPKIGAVCNAVATLRAALDPASAPEVAILALDGTLTPLSATPSFASAGAAWAEKLATWDATEPAFHAAEFLTALDALQSPHADAVAIHPDLTARTWSIRVDGLRIGRMHGAKPMAIRLGVGKVGGAGQPAKDFAAIAGAPIIITQLAEAAAELAVELATVWRTKPGGHGQTEHALETTILRGDLPVKTLAGDTLERVDSSARVLRAGQFPTLWSVQPGARARYLDVVMRVGTTPWAVELKIPSAASAYRRAITQAVLYAAFIRQAKPLHSWFEHRSLDAAACRAAIVIPPDVPAMWRDPLLAVAARFGVAVAEVPPPPPYGA